MNLLTIQIFLFLIFHSVSFAETRVAFLRQYNSQGDLVRLEPSGPGFFHTAIRYKNKWLHTHPWGGVQLSEDLSAFGVVESILVNSEGKEPTEEVVNRYLGRSYDPFFNWDDDKYYCSELIALILNLTPKPMYFEGDYWKTYFHHYGLSSPPTGVGISPDEIYTQLMANGYKETFCEDNLLK